MQEPEAHTSQPDELLSPVEERHIDYILEEEFAVNPDFLRYFVETARRTATDGDRIVGSAEENECIAVRSVSTDKGETDLLVKYSVQSRGLGTAILIENKIRAGFQPDQAACYRERGEAGKGKSWSNYWTCLVSHSKYSVDKGDFDAVVTLQALHQYFAREPDVRSLFRARILKQSIRKYEMTGVQRIDPGMTRLRAMYAAECANYFQNRLWKYDKARDAARDDNSFNFRRTDWPKGVKVVHQARTGLMKLVFPIRDGTILQGLVDQCASWNPHIAAPKIVIMPFGKTGFSFKINVPKITDFSIAAQPPLFEEFFAALEFLADFYKRSSDLLPEALRISPAGEDLAPDENSQLTPLRAMLLGYMRSTVTCLGTGMPYPLPELRRLTAAVPEKERYFASFGLMGGFHLELHEDEKHNPYVIAECSSRQWGADSVRHKITVSEIVELDDEV